MTKWKRLFNALAGAQNQHQIGNHLIMFINRAMNPVNYASDPATFAWRRDELNVVLAFSGFFVRDDGKVAHADKATTLDVERARAGRLKAALESRVVHAEVLNYCRAELLDENYFHAEFEATKGVAERIRLLIGLFGAVRNPLAHAPKTNWPMSEQDALDILTLVSLIHRKLDGTTKLADVSP